MTVAIVGAGSWGTAIAWLLATKGLEVRVWARSDEVASGIEESHRNPRYLTDLELPAAVRCSTNPEATVAGAGIVVVATPSHAVRDAVSSCAAGLSPKTSVVSLAKGLETGTLLRMTEVIGEEVGDPSRVAALSGPNHAEEVSKGIPSATVIASVDPDVARALQDVFSTRAFRVYTNPDVAGVEMAGASKNVIAVATGMSDGLGFGDNSRASLITRGLAEMARLGAAAGANRLTYMGLAGMGDLIATCTSRHSRNRALGEWIGRGGTLEDYGAQTRMVAEGARASVSVGDLGDRLGVDLPITRGVRGILYDGAAVSEAVGALMSRTSTDEFHDLGLLSDRDAHG